MKRYSVYILLIIMAFFWCSWGSVWAADHESYNFEYVLRPSIHYDPIEKFGLGGSLMMTGLLGPDHLNMFAAYSFSAQKINYGTLYLYRHGENFYYSNVINDLRYQGIYGGEAYYQDDKIVNLGVTHKNSYFFGKYLADLMLQYVEFDSQNHPGDHRFDSGRDLVIYPTLVGSYKDYLGKVEFAYGLKSEISDYEYWRVSGLLQKMFKITEKDKFIITTEVGMIDGDYPVQQQFFLGSSKFNLVPNTWQKLLGALAISYQKNFEPSRVYLDGYDDNAFFGDKMYACKCEYQHKLVTVVDEQPISFIGKIFAVFGNAWSGDIHAGLSDPKPALGLGLNITPDFDTSRYVGINLAQGFHKKAAFTIGVEIGFDLSLDNYLNEY